MTVVHINFELDEGAQVPTNLRHLLISSPYKLDTQPHPIEGQAAQVAYYAACGSLRDAVAFAVGLGKLGQDAVSFYDGERGAFILKSGEVSAEWNGYAWASEFFHSPFQNLD